MALRDVNHAPRRWVDRSARVRVVEGWHPSRPDHVGYNLLVDDEWIGTLDTLAEAAELAAQRLRAAGATRRATVTLLPQLQP